MISNKKIIGIIPFIITSAATIYNLTLIDAGQDVFTLPFITGLIFIGLNAIIYFVRYKIAVIMTGILLLLSTFNVIRFSIEKIEVFWSLKIGDHILSTPAINTFCFCMLLLYLALNFNSIKNLVTKLF